MLSYIKDIASIAGAGAQIWNLFRDQDNPAMDAFLQEQADRKRMRDIAMNPNSPEFRNYVALEEEAQRSDFAKAMTEAMRHQNRAMARNSVVTRPERQDEFFNTIRKRLTAGPEAGRKVQANLLNMGQPNTAPAIGAFEGRNQFSRLATDAAIRTGTEGVPRLFDMWSRYNQAPAGMSGISPGRKPVRDDASDYRVWETS